MENRELLIAEWDAKDGANKLSDDKLIRINDNKPDFGSLMLVTPNVVSIENGFMNKRNLTGFISGRVTDLEETIEAYNLKAGMDYNKVFGDHHIVTIEITLNEFTSSNKYKAREDHQKPEESGYKEKINPTTEVVLTNEDGEVIYWKTEVVPVDSEVVTKKIKHLRTAAVNQVDPAEAEFEGNKAPEKAKSK